MKLNETEKLTYNKLKENYKESEIKRGKIFFPDFKLPNKYVEVKTFYNSNYIDFTKKQYETFKELNNVEIWIYDREEEYKETIDFKDIEKKYKIVIKNIRSISISQEADEIIKDNFHSRDFSNWVEERILDELRTDIEKLKLKKGKLLKEVQKIDDSIKDYEVISKDEIKYFEGVKKRLDINPSFISGILKEYYNLFGKRVSREYFYKRMKEALNGNN